VINLLLAHVARADRTDERLVLSPAQREHDQDVPSFVVFADRLEPLLSLGMRGVGENGDRALKQRFNAGDGDAAFLTLL
jgi:hypothetical protein